MGSMRQNLCSSSRAQIPQPPSPPPTTNPTHHLSPISTPPIPTLTCKLSRRHLTATLPFLFTPGHHLSQAQANELDPQSTNTCTTTTPTTTKTAFLDIAIDGEPSGRITIALFADTAPQGSARFASLLTGTAGISYRRKEFVKITPAYIQHVGVRSYGVDADMARRTGGQLAAGVLVAEWEAAADTCPGTTKSVAGSVGLVVRDPARPPPKMKLVARQGKLVVDEEEVGSPEPNGTEFVIAAKDSPELDAAALVVGRVVGGMEVVERIAKVKTVQENTSSPYFRVAKLIGDKRAVVAERGFNRPYSKVVVTNCGLID